MASEETAAGRCFTHQQELLLRACLLQGETAVSAWLRWKENNDFDRLDAGSTRLLPLLYHNLRLQNVDDPLVKTLKEQYVNTWYRNEALLLAVAPILAAFKENGIENVLLKGAALASLAYKDSALRPMVDIDILVRPDMACRAIGLLHEAGWKSPYQSPEALIPFEQAVEFRDAAGYGCDLHWRVLWDGRQEVSDDSFWKRRLPFQVNGVPTSALSPADQLMHVCVHGMAWSQTPSLRWVADAAAILRSDEFNVDWNRLISQTEERRLMLAMKDALGYLRELLDAPVPAYVMDALEKMRPSYRERLFYRIRTDSRTSHKRLIVLNYWLGAWRRLSHFPFHHRLVHFLRYLKSLWNVDHLWQTPFYFAFKSVRGMTLLLTEPIVNSRRGPKQN